MAREEPRTKPQPLPTLQSSSPAVMPTGSAATGAAAPIEIAVAKVNARSLLFIAEPHVVDRGRTADARGARPQVILDGDCHGLRLGCVHIEAQLRQLAPRDCPRVPAKPARGRLSRRRFS